MNWSGMTVLIIAFMIWLIIFLWWLYSEGLR